MPVTETVNLAGLRDTLGRIGAPVRDYSGLLRTVGVYLVATSKRAIMQGRSPGGEKFADWAPSTARRRKGGKILYDKGLMIAAYQTQPIGPTSLLWGNAVSYFRFHQTGTTRKVVARAKPAPAKAKKRKPARAVRPTQIKMPARVTVEASPNVLDRIAQMAADYAVKQLRER